MAESAASILKITVAFPTLGYFRPMFTVFITNSFFLQVTQSTRSDSGSALAALADSATSVGYQLVATTSQSKPMNDHAIINIEVCVSLGIKTCFLRFIMCRNV